MLPVQDPMQRKQSHISDIDQVSKNAALFHAIRKKPSKNVEEAKRRAKVEKCLNEGADVNAQDKNDQDNTVLHIAVKKNYQEIVEFLLAKEAKVSITNSDDKTPLMLAESVNSKQGIIDLLKEHTTTQNQLLSQQLEDDHQPKPQDTELATNSENQETVNTNIATITYASNYQQILKDINASKPEVNVLEIDCREHSPDFLTQDGFYSVLQNKENIFLVDVALNTDIALNEESLKDKLNNIEKHLIIQCGTLKSTTVYVKEPSKERMILDLNAPAEQMQEDELLDKLKNKDSFGIVLIVEALKLELIGKFNDGPDYHRSLTKVTFIENKLGNKNIFQETLQEKALSNCILPDYAVFHNDFLSTCLLSLYHWDLFAMYDEELSTLEIAAKHASLNILAVLLKVQLPISKGDILLSKEAANLLKPSNYYEENTPLLTAVKVGKKDNVDFFIRCGADINHRNNTLKKSAIELAWEQKHYNVVLLLLKADAEFPQEFTPTTLEENDDTKELRSFVENRNTLHRLIAEGNLKQVEKFVTTNRSKLYLNAEGKSAVLAAIEKEQYQIYAFLKCKGMDFKNKEEQESIESKLNNSQKEKLKNWLIQYFPKIDNSHISYLLSKTRGANPIDENFQKEVLQLYKELNNIGEISTILEVVQYSDYLDIIMDFNKKSIIDTNPTAKETTKGEYFFKEGRLYLAAKGADPEVLGTLAHEFTHVAMQIVYNNDCNPYRGILNNETEFKNITKILLKELTEQDIEIDSQEAAKKIINSKGKDEIITRAFTAYKNPAHWPSELVVRVPHMLSKYGQDKGLELLKQQVPELLQYYQQHVLSDCKDFIDKSYLIKPRNIIKSLNQYSRIIIDVIEAQIQFNKIINLNEFLDNTDQNILLLSTTNTRLSSINVYQSLQTMLSYASGDSYLFFEFDRYHKQQTEIDKAFYSEGGSLLLVEYSTNSNEKQLSTILEPLSVILKEKPNKKIIFIIHKREVIDFTKSLNSNKYLKNKYYEDKYFEEDFKDFTLHDLTAESQRKILEKPVMFQGERVSLNTLIDEKSKEIIDSETLVKLINNDEVTIGHALISLGDTKNYYIKRTFNYQTEIKTEMFDEEKIKDLLVISGIDKTNLSRLVKEPNKICPFQELKTKPDKIKHIRFITLDNDAKEQFNQLRQDHQQLNIHWLKSESGRFIWQQSRGDICGLHQYIETDASHTKQYIETELLSQTDRDKVVIISDTAGMGKSTVLTRLSQRIKETNRNLWIVRVDLNNYTKELQKQKDKSSFKTQDIDKAMAFLTNDLLKLGTPLETALFQHYCHCQKMIIMFDGFDEISPDYREMVIDLMQVLRNSGIKQLWVTTRPTEKKVLEDELQQFVYTLEVFSKENQIQFLTKFWQQQAVSKVNQEQLKIYAEALIELLTKSISDKDTEFTGIPLQTRMLAEAFETDVTEFCTSNKAEPQLLEKLKLTDLYERFVRKKYEIQLGKSKLDLSQPIIKGRSEIWYSEFIEQHQNMALYTLFSAEKLTLLLKEKFYQEFSKQHPVCSLRLDTEELKKCLFEEGEKKINVFIKDKETSKENTGIIDQIIEDKPHFIHRTFAEYFVAKFLVASLENKTIAEFLLQEILVQWDYEVIRAFFNQSINQLTIETLPVSTLELYGDKIVELWQFDEITILQIAAVEKNMNILRFLLSCRFEKNPEISQDYGGNVDTDLRHWKHICFLNSLRHWKFWFLNYASSIGWKGANLNAKDNHDKTAVEVRI